MKAILHIKLCLQAKGQPCGSKTMRKIEVHKKNGCFLRYKSGNRVTKISEAG